MGNSLRSFANGFKKARGQAKDRNGKNYTQDSFAEEFGKSLDTIKNWEQGRNSPHADTLIDLCDFFDCDMGYLFCEYNEKHHKIADIQKETGLEPDVINIILNMKNSFLKLSILNELLQDDYFLAIINLLYMADYHYEKCAELARIESSITEAYKQAETSEEKEKLQKRFDNYTNEHTLHNAKAEAHRYKLTVAFSRLLDKRYDPLQDIDEESQWKRENPSYSHSIVF